MMISIFTALALVLLLGWFGWHRTAIAVFVLNLLFALFVFWIHMTDILVINY